MNPEQICLEEPGLLGLLTVCGVRTEAAPSVLCAFLAGGNDRRPWASGRVALYQGLISYLQICEFASDQAVAQVKPAGQSHGDAVNTLAWDLKAAIFLVAALNFCLRDAAEILHAEPTGLAARLERAQDMLARSRRRGWTPRKR